MDDSGRLRPRVFFLVAFFLVLGIVIKAWAVAFVATGLGLLLWIFFYTWLTSKNEWMEQEARRISEYRRLTPEGRAELGYMKVPEQVKVTTTRKDPQGYDQTRYDLIPTSPPKLFTFFHGVLAGRGLGFRTWTPLAAGKLFSDSEYEKVTKKLYDLKYIEKSSDNATPDLTDLGLVAVYEHCMKSGQIDPSNIHPPYYVRLVDLGVIERKIELDSNLEDIETILTPQE